jgi:hypothetical protein
MRMRSFHLAAIPAFFTCSVAFALGLELEFGASLGKEKMESRTKFNYSQEQKSSAPMNNKKQRKPKQRTTR